MYKWYILVRNFRNPYTLANVLFLEVLKSHGVALLENRNCLLEDIAAMVNIFVEQLKNGSTNRIQENKLGSSAPRFNDSSVVFKVIWGCHLLNAVK